MVLSTVAPKISYMVLYTRYAKGGVFPPSRSGGVWRLGRDLYHFNLPHFVDRLRIRGSPNVST